MYREPHHYPRWLRVLLFDPVQRLARNMNSNPERNWKTLREIQITTYRIDDFQALVFDIVIEMERGAIDDQEFKKRLKAVFCSMNDRMRQLESRVEELEEKKKKRVKKE